MSDFLSNVAILLYDFALVAGTTYVVIVYDWSMWTYALTLCFFMTKRTKKDESE